MSYDGFITELQTLTEGEVRRRLCEVEELELKIAPTNQETVLPLLCGGMDG